MGTIHLNTVLLILVSIAGFLGSMIHIASSFTNFVGTGKFKRSWVLWYIVKPFTGSALAIVVYVVFRGGFFSFNDPANINIYGMVTLAFFAGLFADDATLKLKEVFEVIFKPRDTRPDKLENGSFAIKAITPDKLLPDRENVIMVSGEGLNKKKLVIKINGEAVTNSVVKADTIVITYKIPDTQKDKKEFKLVISDEQGKELDGGSKVFKAE
jgi:hypothetical protein